MSYAVTSHPRSVRPTTVTVAVGALYAAAALTALYSVLFIVLTATVDQAVATGTTSDPEMTDTIATITNVVSIALYLMVAAGLGTVAFLVGRGKQPARIVAWVIGGLVALCCGCGLLSNLALTGMTGALDEATQDAVREAQEAVPTWYTVSSNIVGVLVIVATLVAVIALAMPASNDFFRAENQVWVAPTWPGPAGPGMPPGPAGMPPSTGMPEVGPGAGYPPAAQYPPSYPPQSDFGGEPRPPDGTR